MERNRYGRFLRHSRKVSEKPEFEDTKVLAAGSMYRIGGAHRAISANTPQPTYSRV